MFLASQASTLWNHWSAMLPDCGEEDCSLRRRLWRRLHWWNGAIRLQGVRYCAPQCFESALRQRFCRLGTAIVEAPHTQHRIPLGLLLLSRGQLTNRQLRCGLDAQSASGRRLGECLQGLGFVSEQQVTAALGLQWACPVLALRENFEPECAHLLPYRLLERFRMLPVQFVTATRTFYIAFCEGIDYRALYAIEQMLACRTEPCVIGRSALDRTLEQIARERRDGDFLFEGWRPAREMAHITSGYMLKLGANEVGVVACGDLIWARLAAGRDAVHLLFRRPGTIDESAADEPAAFLIPRTG